MLSLWTMPTLDGERWLFDRACFADGLSDKNENCETVVSLLVSLRFGLVEGCSVLASLNNFIVISRFVFKKVRIIWTGSRKVGILSVLANLVKTFLEDQRQETSGLSVFQGFFRFVE
jgi:hypothetical protein